MAKTTKPTMSAEAKRVLQAQERQLRRIAKKQAEEAITSARQIMDQAKYRETVAGRVVNNTALMQGIRSLVMATEASWGVSAPINIRSENIRSISASTNFRSIDIQYPDRLVPHSQGEFDQDVLRRLISDIKGVAYHEVGHIRFTVPFPSLTRNVPDHLMEVRGCHTAWNILEDQRMERLVVKESPVIAGYFTVMILTHIVDDGDPQDSTYILLAGRKYLPVQVRRAARDRFVAKFGKPLADRVDACVRSYIGASNVESMLQAVHEMNAILNITGASERTPRGVDDHDRWGNPIVNEDDVRKRVADTASDTEDDSEGLGSTPEGGDTESEDEDEDEDEAEDEGSEGDSTDGDGTDTGTDTGESDEGKGGTEDGAPERGGNYIRSDKEPTGTPDPDASPAGPSSGAGVSEQGDSTDSMKELKDALNDALSSARDSISNDASVDSTIRDINAAAASGEVEPLPRNVPTGMNTEAGISSAVSMAEQLERELMQFTAENEPVWGSRQDRGIIDTFQYRTRISGSRDYHRRMTDVGDIGSDIAVTLILDNSGSMDGTEAQLGATAFACKQACQRLNIPASVLVFNSFASILWTADDQPTHLSIGCTGGTSPEEALQVVSEFRYDKPVHIIIVMTDGAFDYSFQGCDKYRSEGQVYIGLGLQVRDSTVMFRQKQFDFGADIASLDEVPRYLGEFLTAAMR